MVVIGLEKLKADLLRGVRENNYMLYATGFIPGRFVEEENTRIMVVQGNTKALLMFLKLFHGRHPYYAPWVELYAINWNPLPELHYAGSRLEEKFLSIIASNLPPGSKIYVEYLGDRETEEQLQRGYPEQTSRLGYILFTLGFTWLKDWYFPEGFLEGGFKIQGEKPLTEADRSRQLTRAARELKAFISKECRDDVCRRARARAEKLLEMILHGDIAV